MKTKLTLAALIAFGAIANATPGQISPVSTPKTKHVVRTGHLSDIHMPNLHNNAHSTPANTRVSASLGHPPTAPGPK